MAEMTQPTESHRDKVRKRISTQRPDLNMDDEEAVYGAISEDYDNYDNISKENEEYRKREQGFADFITSGEHNGQYWEGLANGEDLFAIATKIHGRDNLLEYLQSDAAVEKYAKAEEEYQKRIAADRELKASQEKNLAETDKALTQAIEEGRFTEDEATQAIEGLFEIADAMNLHTVKPEWVEMWLKAQAYDHDVESARSEGHEAGVNEGIDRQMRSRRQQRGGTGPNMPIGGSGKSAESRKAGGTIADQLFESKQ